MRIKRILAAILTICLMASALCINVGAAISFGQEWSIRVTEDMFVGDTLVVAENDEEFWNDSIVSVTDSNGDVGSSELIINGSFGPLTGEMTAADAILTISSSTDITCSTIARTYFTSLYNSSAIESFIFPTKELIDSFVSLGGTNEDFKVVVTFADGYENYLSTATYASVRVPRALTEKDIVVDMHFPKAGENFSFDISAPEGADYTVSDLTWRVANTQEVLTASDKAEAGVQYSYDFTVDFEQSLGEEVYVRFTTVDGTAPNSSFSYHVVENIYEFIGNYIAPLELSLDVPVPHAGDDVVTAVDLPEGISVYGDNEGIQWYYDMGSTYLTVLPSQHYYDTTLMGQLLIDIGMAYDNRDAVKISIPGWTQVSDIFACDGSTPVFHVKKLSGETDVVSIRFLASTETGEHINLTASISQPPKAGEDLYTNLVNGVTNYTNDDVFKISSFTGFGNIVWHIKEDGEYTKISDTSVLVEEDASYYGYTYLRTTGLNTDITLNIPGWTQINSAAEATGAPEYVLKWEPYRNGNRWWLYFYFDGEEASALTPLNVTFDVPVPEAGDTIVREVELPEGITICQIPFVAGDEVPTGIEWSYLDRIEENCYYFEALTGDKYPYDTMLMGSLRIDLGDYIYDETELIIDIPGWTESSSYISLDFSEPIFEVYPCKAFSEDVGSYNIPNAAEIYFYCTTGEAPEQPKDTLPDDLTEESKSEIGTIGGESVEDGVIIPANTEIVIADETTELTPEDIVNDTIEAEKEDKNTKYYLKTEGFAGIAIIEGEDTEGNPVRATLEKPTYTSVEEAPEMLFSLESLSSNKIVTGYYSISALYNAYVRAGGVMDKISCIKIVSENESLVTAVSIVTLTENGRVTGWFMTGDKYHARIIGDAIISMEHEYDENGVCTYCRYKKTK